MAGEVLTVVNFREQFRATAEIVTLVHPVVKETVEKLSQNEAFVSRWCETMTTIREKGGKNIEWLKMYDDPDHKISLALISYEDGGLHEPALAFLGYMILGNAAIMSLTGNKEIMYLDIIDKLLKKELDMAVSFISLMHTILPFGDVSKLEMLLDSANNENVHWAIPEIRKDYNGIQQSKSTEAANNFLYRVFIPEFFDLLKRGLETRQGVRRELYEIVKSPLWYNNIILTDRNEERKLVLALCSFYRKIISTFPLTYPDYREGEIWGSAMREIGSVWKMPIVNIPMLTAYVQAFEAQLTSESNTEDLKSYPDKRYLVEKLSAISQAQVGANLYRLILRSKDGLNETGT